MYTEQMMKDFFNMGNNFVNGVTVSGGNKSTTAYFSFANTSANGIIPNNEYAKNNLSFKQSTKLLNDKLEHDFKCYVGFRTYQQPKCCRLLS